jgi:hypothetical protein
LREINKRREETLEPPARMDAIHATMWMNFEPELAGQSRLQLIKTSTFKI